MSLVMLIELDVQLQGEAPLVFVSYLGQIVFYGVERSNRQLHVLVLRQNIGPWHLQ